MIKHIFLSKKMLVTIIFCECMKIIIKFNNSCFHVGLFLGRCMLLIYM